MGDPVTGFIVGGTALAGSTYLSGRQQRNAYKTEATQLETQKKAIETNAAIAEAERMRKLKTVLAAQNAAFAMSGQTAGVGTANAIQAASFDEVNREQRMENLQTDLAKTAYDYNIWSSKKASKLAMSTAIINTSLAVAGAIGSSMIKGSFKGSTKGGE